MGRHQPAKPCLKGRTRHYFGKIGKRHELQMEPKNICSYCGFNRKTGEYDWGKRGVSVNE